METATGNVPTRTEMFERLNHDAVRLEAASAGLVRAQSDYARATARYNYATAEAHAASYAEHLPALEAAERWLAEVADDAQAFAFGVLGQARSARLAIPPAAEVEANRQRPDIEHLIATATLPELAERLRAAIVGENVGEQYLWATYLPARLEAKPADGEAWRPEIDAARTALRRMVGQVRDTYRDTSLDGLKRQADGILAKANTAKTVVWKQQTARTPARTHDGQVKVPWPDRQPAVRR